MGCKHEPSACRGCKNCPDPGSTPTVTERQAVERERRAFVRGCGWQADGLYRRGLIPRRSMITVGEDETEAYRRYPLPKVRRLRDALLGDMGSRYRWNPESGFEVSPPNGGWGRAAMTNRAFIESNLEVLADLKANPWEEVECD